MTEPATAESRICAACPRTWTGKNFVYSMQVWCVAISLAAGSRKRRLWLRFGSRLHALAPDVCMPTNTQRAPPRQLSRRTQPKSTHPDLFSGHRAGFGKGPLLTVVFVSFPFPTNARSITARPIVSYPIDSQASSNPVRTMPRTACHAALRATAE